MEPTKKDVNAQDSFVIRHRQRYWAYMNGQGAGTVHMNYVYDVHAGSTYDAAHLFLAKAKEQVIRELLPIPSLETISGVTVNGKVHKVPGAKLQRWIMKRRSEWKGPRELLFSQRPILGL